MSDEVEIKSNASLTRVERALMFFSPRAALKRFQSRVSLQQAARAYEAIENSRLRKKKIDQRSPDQLNQVSAESLRFQARNLDDNHDLAKSVLNTLVASVVGRGIRSFPMVKDRQGNLLDSANEAIQNWWDRWCKRPEVTHSYSWDQLQRLNCRTWFRDGEVFTRKLLGVVSDHEHSTSVMYSLQALEPDFCPIGLTEKENSIRQGIRHNSWGRPLEYYLYPDYPTEQFDSGSFGIGTVILPISASLHIDKDTLNRVSAMDMTHLKMSDRLNAMRGSSLFASVFTRLEDLKDYEESERIAARVGAAFALAITKTIDSASPDTTSAPNWREMDFAPGMIADSLAPGEKIETIKNERPSNQLTDFRRSQLRAIAGGTRSGYSSVAKEYEGSYSSQRQELQEQNLIYGLLRQEYISSQVWPVWVDFVQMLVLQGLIPNINQVDPMTLFDAEHVGAGVPYIEPKREVEADAIAVEKGFKSQSQVILERTGRNPADVRRERAMEQQANEEAGLSSIPEEQPGAPAAEPSSDEETADTEAEVA